MLVDGQMNYFLQLNGQIHDLWRPFSKYVNLVIKTFFVQLANIVVWFKHTKLPIKLMSNHFPQMPVPVTFSGYTEEP